MKQVNKKYLPEYTDGFFDLYRIKTDETQSFPEEKLENLHMQIWYREISIFDRVRYELAQSDLEVTLKIRIPRFKGVDSKCVCLIDGIQHEVYNATGVYDKNGYPETEITLKKPMHERNIEEDAKDEETGT